ncbi:MAG: hypothetical protein ACC742_04705 [Thermoanaerobaculales bacterium]
MASTTRSQRLFTLIACLVLTAACASSSSQPDLTIDLDDDANFTVAVSTILAREVVDGLVGSHLDCKGELDPEVETMLQILDKRGPRSSATYRDEDTTVVARRRGAKLHLEIRGTGSGAIEATMPWTIAECLLGRETSVDRAVRSSIKVKVTAEDGSTYSFLLN